MSAESEPKVRDLVKALEESLREARRVESLRCHCVWLDERCPNPATQEDGLCDWCGERRPDQLQSNPKALLDPLTGDFMALGGAGEAHVNPTVSPDACWMPNSGRTIAPAVPPPEDAG